MVDIYMKRSAKIYMVLLVWIAAALQFFINEKKDMEDVFASMQEADTQMEIHADISAWGVYEMVDSEKSENEDSKDACPRLTPAKINNLLMNTAGYFGISAGELTVAGWHDSITTFQSNGDPAFWRITFIDNSVAGQGYLVVQTDRIEAVDRIHTFFDDLNIKETVSIEADIYADSMTQERILQELPVTGLLQLPDGWYASLNSTVHVMDMKRNKNVYIQERTPEYTRLQIGDNTELIRLFAFALRR